MKGNTGVSKIQENVSVWEKNSNCTKNQQEKLNLYNQWRIIQNVFSNMDPNFFWWSFIYIFLFAYMYFYIKVNKKSNLLKNWVFSY